MSTDLRSIRPEYKKILLNKAIIGVNQDLYGIMGRQIYNVSSLVFPTCYLHMSLFGKSVIHSKVIKYIEKIFDRF